MLHASPPRAYTRVPVVSGRTDPRTSRVVCESCRMSVTYSEVMATPGSAEEYLRLAEHYRRLTDEELIVLAGQKESLTGAAQQILSTEIVSRQLTVPPPAAKSSARSLPPPDSGDEDDPYAEDRELIEIVKVWSRADALRLERVLDVAGIPFYMGSENATGVDDVISNFAEGVEVKVMRVGVPWAWQAMEGYHPQDEQPQPENEDAGGVTIRCPRCRETDIVFHDLINPGPTPKAAPKYHWTCASCGHEWEDEGVEKKT